MYLLAWRAPRAELHRYSTTTTTAGIFNHRTAAVRQFRDSARGWRGKVSRRSRAGHIRATLKMKRMLRNRGVVALCQLLTGIVWLEGGRRAAAGMVGIRAG